MDDEHGYPHFRKPPYGIQQEEHIHFGHCKVPSPKHGTNHRQVDGMVCTDFLFDRMTEFETADPTLRTLKHREGHVSC